MQIDLRAKPTTGIGKAMQTTQIRLSSQIHQASIEAGYYSTEVAMRDDGSISMTLRPSQSAKASWIMSAPMHEVLRAAQADEQVAEWLTKNLSKIRAMHDDRHHHLTKKNNRPAIG